MADVEGRGGRRREDGIQVVQGEGGDGMKVVPGMEFGEGAMWKRRRHVRPLGKLSCMWEDRIYLGVKGTTGEMIFGDKKGVWRTRTVRRKTLGERWAMDNFEMVGGVPWQMGDVDGEDLKLEVTIMDKDYRERMC